MRNRAALGPTPAGGRRIPDGRLDAERSIPFARSWDQPLWSWRRRTVDHHIGTAFDAGELTIDPAPGDLEQIVDIERPHLGHAVRIDRCQPVAVRTEGDVDHHRVVPFEHQGFFSGGPVPETDASICLAGHHCFCVG